MTVKERIEQIKQNGYKVQQKALGEVELTDIDFVRIYQLGEKTLNAYIVDIPAIKSGDVKSRLLDKEIVKEEVWYLRPWIAIDLYV